MSIEGIIFLIISIIIIIVFILALIIWQILEDKKETEIKTIHICNNCFNLINYKKNSDRVDKIEIRKDYNKRYLKIKVDYSNMCNECFSYAWSWVCKESKN